MTMLSVCLCLSAPTINKGRDITMATKGSSLLWGKNKLKAIDGFGY
jgi:hypothetical protein